MAQRTTSYRITGDASQFASSMQEAAKRAEQMEGSLTSLESHLSSITGETLEFDQAVNRYRNSSGQFVAGTEAQERALSNLRGQLQATERAQDQVQQSTARMGTSVSSTANNLGFEMVQASQDAKFGMVGLANQIPLMSEQFQRLQAQTGSTSAALKTLGTTFLGPTGVIAGITLGLTFLPDLISSTDDAGDSAEEASEDFDAASQSIQGFTDAARSSNTVLSNMDSIVESINQRAQRLGQGTLSGSLETLAAQQGRAVSPTGGPTAAATEFQQQQALRRVRGLLRQNTGEVRVFRSSLRALGVDVDEILQDNLEGNLEEVREEITQNIQRFEDLGQTIRQAVGEDIGVVADDIMTRFGRMGDRLETEVQTGLIDPVDEAEQRVNFLQNALESLSESGVDITQDEFDPLFAALEEWRTRLEALQSENEKAEEELTGFVARLDEAKTNTDELAESINDLGQTVTGPGGHTSAIEEATFRQERFNEALQNTIDRMEDASDRRAQMRAFGIPQGTAQARDMPGAGPQQSGDPLSRQNIRSLDLLPMQSGTEETAESVQQINLGLTQSIQLASQLGATMVQAAQQGEIKWNQLLGSILQTVGAAVGAANPAAGAALAGGGTLISAFEHGGTVNTPFQIVGEEGPEIAALPQGTQIYDHETSAAMMQRGGSMTVRLETSVQRLPGGDIGLVVRENESRRAQFGYSDR